MPQIAPRRFYFENSFPEGTSLKRESWVNDFTNNKNMKESNSKEAPLETQSFAKKENQPYILI